MNKYITITSFAGFGVLLYLIIINALSLPEAFLWFFKIVILFVFYKYQSKVAGIKRIDKFGLVILFLFIIWQIIGFIRGSFDAGNNYWIWKCILNNLLVTLFYIVILYASNPLWVSKIYHLYWKYFILLSAIAIIFLGNPLFVNYLPYSTMLLFWPAIPKKNKYLLIFIVAYFFILNSQRNDLAKIAFAVLCGLVVCRLYKYIPVFLFKIFHIVLLILPFVFIWLAVYADFNVFKFDEYIKGDYTATRTEDGKTVKEDLLSDTRTFIYKNTFFTINEYDAWIIGRNTAHGDEGYNPYIDQQTGTKGRYGNEVGITNILLWYGLIGAFLYFVLYARASYLAIYRSKNSYMKIIGIYTSFLWLWSFIWEKCLFETFYLMNIIFIGICLSSSFRNMTNLEFRKWINGIFK